MKLFEWFKRKKHEVNPKPEEIARNSPALQLAPDSIYRPAKFVEPLSEPERLVEPNCEHRFIRVGGGGRRCQQCGWQPDLVPASGPFIQRCGSYVRAGFDADGRVAIHEISASDGKRIASAPHGRGRAADCELLARWSRRG